MAQDSGRKKENHSRASLKWGWIFLALWAVFIMAGIVAKRAFGLPDLMVFFHLPAAVFLVLSFYKLSVRIRAEYQKSLRQNEGSKAENPQLDASQAL